MLPSIGGDLHWEMFWSGEIKDVDQKLFSEKFSTGNFHFFLNLNLFLTFNCFLSY
jgi:hypothetical protein